MGQCNNTAFCMDFKLHKPNNLLYIILAFKYIRLNKKTICRNIWFKRTIMNFGDKYFQGKMRKSTVNSFNNDLHISAMLDMYIYN